MRDRVPTYPGRMKLTPVPGQPNIYDMTMADDPIEPGTPPTKANLLSDETETALWGDAQDRTVDEAFGQVKTLLAPHSYVKLIDITTTVAAAQIDVDMSGIDMSRLMGIDVYLRDFKTSGGNKVLTAQLTLNGNANAIYALGYTGNSTLFAGYVPVLLASGSNKEGAGAFFTLINGASGENGVRILGQLSKGHASSASEAHPAFGVIAIKEISFSGIQALNFFSADSAKVIDAGAKIKIYGVTA
jgi:hypothetical protein